MHTRLVIVFILGILLGVTARSAVAADDFANELTALAGWTVGGSFADTAANAERDLDEAPAFGLILNRRHQPMTEWELYLSRQPTEVEGSTDVFDVDVEYLHLGGNVAFEAGKGRSYVAATLGATRLRPGDGRFDSETRFSAALGGGLKYPLGDRAGLRFDVRAFATVVDNDTGFLCVSDPDVVSGCAVTFDGDLFWQVVGSAGISVRF